MLKGKTVLLGVTGSIAAYKIAYLASALKKLPALVSSFVFLRIVIVRSGIVPAFPVVSFVPVPALPVAA